MSLRPLFMTERDEPIVRDCGGAAALMGINKATHNKYAATRANRERIMRLAGTTESHEAVSIRTLNIGWTQFADWSPEYFEGSLAAFLKELSVGRGAAVFGYYAKLDAVHRAPDLKFAAKGDASYHVGYVQREGAGRVRWMDPDVKADPSYVGSWMDDAELGRFMTGYGSPARALIVTENEHYQKPEPALGHRVIVSAPSFRRYIVDEKSRTVTGRIRVRTGGFSADATGRYRYRYGNLTLELCQLLTGSRKDQWLNVNGQNVDYRRTP